MRRSISAVGGLVLIAGAACAGDLRVFEAVKSENQTLLRSLHTQKAAG